ncbi:MAG: putative lipid II flippase FtsW [Rhodobacteraceae bacterium]|nr:putative lipid II flippase FtsW [Paracoccaceae bacterium]
MTEMVHGGVRVQTGEPVLPRWWRTIDKWTLAAVFGLFGIGLLLGLAASVPLAERNGLAPFYYVERQMAFGGMALAAMVLTSMLSPDLVRRLAVLGFAVVFVSLLLLPFLGTDFGKGATRWYSLGFASVQPSEFLKPAFVVLCAWLMAAAQEINGPPGRLFSFVLALVVATLLALQPDFGQAALILFAWGVMYFVAGAPLPLLIGLAGGTNAIQEGGFFGVGIGEGQVKWSLPDAHTDFIIAVAAEEYGLVMVVFVIGLFAVVVTRSLARLMRERDPFIRLAGTGLACIFGVQAIINMGVAVRLLPAKGMTLPFVSYGGSSLIAGGILVGMLLAFTRTRPQGRIADAFGRSRGR